MRTLFIALLALSSLRAFAGADDPVTDDLVPFDFSSVKVGDWVQYEQGGGDARVTQRIACVGEDGDALTVEITESTAGGSLTKALVVSRKTSVVSRAWVKEAGKDAKEVPVRKPAQPAGAEEKGTGKGAKESEKVKVKGSTFDCAKLEIETEGTHAGKKKLTLWISDAVPIRLRFDEKTGAPVMLGTSEVTWDARPTARGGLVKSTVDHDGLVITTTLTDWGSDAKPTVETGK